MEYRTLGAMVGARKGRRPMKLGNLPLKAHLETLTTKAEPSPSAEAAGAPDSTSPGGCDAPAVQPGSAGKAGCADGFEHSGAQPGSSLLASEALAPRSAFEAVASKKPLDWSAAAATVRQKEYWSSTTDSPDKVPPVESQTSPMGAPVRNGRVVMQYGLRMRLATFNIGKLSELPREQLLEFLSAEMSRLVSPVRIKADWSDKPRQPGAAHKVVLNPADPRRGASGAAAEACFLPLEPSKRYAQIELLGTSTSSCKQEGKKVPDFETGELRDIRPGDGAYGALFLVRDDGWLIPLHQGLPNWGESTKFFDNDETDTLFGLDIEPAQSEGVIGAVLMNVSQPTRRDPDGATRVSAFTLRQFDAYEAQSPVHSQLVYFDSAEAVKANFPQLGRAEAVETAQRAPGSRFDFVAKTATDLHVHYLGEPGTAFTVRRDDGEVEQHRLPAWQGIEPVKLRAGERVTVEGESIRAIAVDEGYDSRQTAERRLGLQPEVAQIFNRATERCFGAATAEGVRAQIEAEMAGHVSTARMSELFRNCRPLSALVGHLLAGEFAKKNSCSKPGDVMFRLFDIAERFKGSAWFTSPTVLSEQLHAEGFPRSMVPPDLESAGFRHALDAGDSAAVLTALGESAEADLEQKCADGAFLERFFCALLAAGRPALKELIEIFSLETAADLYSAAHTEFNTIHDLLGEAYGHNCHLKTPSQFMRAMFPRTLEDLKLTGIKCRKGADGSPLVLLSRSGPQDNALLHIPHGRQYLGELSSDKQIPSQAHPASWARAMQHHTLGETLEDVTSPFSSWSTGSGAAKFAQPDSNLVFAEVPPQELIVNILYGYPDEREVLLTANNPANIRLVVRVDREKGKSDKVKLGWLRPLSRELLGDKPLKGDEVQRLFEDGSRVAYLRDALRVDSPRHGVEGEGPEAVSRLLDEELELTAMDEELARRGLRRIDGCGPQAVAKGRAAPKGIAHPTLGLLRPTSSPAQPSYGIPYVVARERFVDESGRSWELPVAYTRRDGRVFLEEVPTRGGRVSQSRLAAEELAAQPVGTRVQAFVSQCLAHSAGLESASVAMTRNGGIENGPVRPWRLAGPEERRIAAQFLLDALLGRPADPRKLAEDPRAMAGAGGFVDAKGRLSPRGWTSKVDLEKLTGELPASHPLVQRKDAFPAGLLREVLKELEDGGLMAEFGAALETALSCQDPAELGEGGPEALRHELVLRMQARVRALEEQLSRAVNRNPTELTNGGNGR